MIFLSLSREGGVTNHPQLKDVIMMSVNGRASNLFSFIMLLPNSGSDFISTMGGIVDMSPPNGRECFTKCPAFDRQGRHHDADPLSVVIRPTLAQSTSSGDLEQQRAPSCLLEGIQQKERDLVSQGCFTDVNGSSYPALPDGSAQSGIICLPTADNLCHGVLNLEGTANSIQWESQMALMGYQENQRSICDRLQQIEIQSLNLDADDISGGDAEASLPQCTASPLIELTSMTPAGEVSGATSRSPRASCQRKTRPPPSSSPRPTPSKLRKSGVKSSCSGSDGPTPRSSPAKRTRKTPHGKKPPVVNPPSGGIVSSLSGPDDVDTLPVLATLQMLQQQQEQQLAALREHQGHLLKMYEMQEQALHGQLQKEAVVSSAGAPSEVEKLDPFNGTEEEDQMMMAIMMMGPDNMHESSDLWDFGE